MSNILLTNANLLMPDGLVVSGALAISDDIIAAIGDVPAVIKADTIIDCKSGLVTPGLVNTHTHVAMTMLRGWADDLSLEEWLLKKILPFEDYLKPEDIYWSSLAGISEMLLAGITGFADQYFHTAATAEAVIQSGIRARLARGLVAIGNNPEVGFYQRLQENKSLFFEFNGTADGRLHIDFGPHAIYSCPLNYMVRAAEEAFDIGAGLQIHIAETLREVNECKTKYGHTPVKLLALNNILSANLIAAHCVHITNEEINLLYEFNVHVSHCPNSNLKLASGIAPIQALSSAGVNVSIGTDSAASNNSQDVLRDLQTAALVQKCFTNNPRTLPVLQLINMVTKNASKALRIKAGQLTVGQKADIVIWDTDKPHWHPRHNYLSNISYSAQSSDVNSVIVDGQLLVRNHQLLTIDCEQVLSEMGKRVLKIGRNLLSQ